MHHHALIGRLTDSELPKPFAGVELPLFVKTDSGLRPVDKKVEVTTFVIQHGMRINNNSSRISSFCNTNYVSSLFPFQLELPSFV